MEHLTHFGLKRDPFTDDLTPGFYLATPQHRDAERRLARGVHSGRALSVLTGPVGAGKTGIVRRLIEGLEEEVFAVSLVVPVPGASDGGWVLDSFARQLGVEAPERDRLPLLAQIYEHLSIVHEDGRKAVLIIDEAQVLEKDTLDVLQGLLNLEYEDRRLLSIVLIGQPALDEVLGRDPALAERVDVRVRLGALDADAARDYLIHRIQVAGGDPRILDESAQSPLATLSRGIPQALNALADNALYEAFLAGRKTAGAADVVAAAKDLGLAREDLVVETPPESLHANLAEPAPAPLEAPLEAPEPTVELLDSDPEVDDESLLGAANPDAESNDAVLMAAMELEMEPGLGDTELSIDLSEPVPPGSPEATEFLPNDSSFEDELPEVELEAVVEGLPIEDEVEIGTFDLSEPSAGVPKDDDDFDVLFEDLLDS